MKDKGTLKSSFENLGLSPAQRLAVLFLNYIPFLHTAAVACTAILPWAAPPWRIVAAVLLLYLAPPLVARAILRLWPIREGHIHMPSRDYFAWWALLNLQVVFCRLTFLEELIRLIPGAYSVWLRLWGAHIGAFVYWAAGLRILDRSFLDIGHGVAFGAGVRLNPHVIARDEQGRLELLLATVHIGDGALIGGYGLLTSGTRVEDGEVTRACLLSAPFSHWKGGKRIKPDNAAGPTDEAGA